MPFREVGRVDYSELFKKSLHHRSEQIDITILSVASPAWFDRFLSNMILRAPSMKFPYSLHKPTGVLSVGLILILLVIAPFAVAQDIHHELAAVDHDGHEHSDSDICQWVQQHICGSFTIALPPLASWDRISDQAWFPVTILVSSSFVRIDSTRAPPRS